MKYTAAGLSINFTVDWFFPLREEKNEERQSTAQAQDYFIWFCVESFLRKYRIS